MKRYTVDDVRRDEDPEGSWVLYEDVKHLLTSKSQLFRVSRQRGKSQMFNFHRDHLRTLYGAPRTQTNGNIKREYFELEDGKVIMFASPLPTSKG